MNLKFHTQHGRQIDNHKSFMPLYVVMETFYELNGCITYTHFSLES